MISNEKDIIKLVHEDKKMMKILEVASTLNLPDWWICAGFVRSKIWDELHGFRNRNELPDVDVIYFDESSLDEVFEKELEEKLKSIMPDVPWSVKNQARMHLANNIPPYTSSEDAISKFPETATALGVKLDERNNLILTAPLGIMDVINLEVKPTPFFKETKERAEIYEIRIHKKNWQEKWNRLKIYHF